MLSAYCPHVSVLYEADSVTTGFAAISRLNPDMVCLDIQMKDGTGFDLLKKFTPINFRFIIVTAYEDYAIKAFKYCALDYLLKPIDPDELVSAIERISRLVNTEFTNRKFEALLANMEVPGMGMRKVVLNTHDNLYVIDIHDIVRCEAHNNTTEFHLKNGNRILVSKTLKEFEEMLPQQNFFRCHQSHLVNLNFVSRVHQFPTPAILLANGVKIPVAVRKRAALSKLL
jgi:two-component system LytT family response regulator